MDKAKVYFTSFKATGQENLLQKLHRLMKTAGFETIDFQEKYTAIKIHFGEYGNLAFLRPNYARVVADYVKELGGRPFLTDCNTLYVGSRKNAQWIFAIPDRMPRYYRRWAQRDGRGNRAH